tara:strand:+ start:125 stop:1489 length:1365 start_codon:yes stop_codon:yes gene_type:complete
MAAYINLGTGFGNSKTYTISAWVKGSNQYAVQEDNPIMSAGSGSDGAEFRFNDGSLEFYNYPGSYSARVQTNARCDDVNAWYHVVAAIDTPQASSSDRIKLYINGVQETSLAQNTYPAQDAQLYIGNASDTHYVANNYSSGQQFLGLMTHFAFVNGTALTPTSFGETDTDTGIWKPKSDLSGLTWGTKGFWLKFENSADLDLDSSSNANTFSTSGTITQTSDTPSNNFAVLNVMNFKNGGPTIANGLTTVTSDGGTKFCYGTSLGVNKGKYYAEFKIVGNEDSATHHIGITSDPTTSASYNQFPGEDNISYSYGQFGSWWYNNSGTATGTTYTTGDIVGLALDCDNSKLYFSKNGTWISIGGVQGDPTSGATGTGAISINAPTANTGNGFWHMAIGDNSGTYGGANVVACNFGNGYFQTSAVASAGTSPSEGGVFEYDCPSGYQALCTKGINSF